MPELDYIPLFLDFYDRYSELSYEERGRLVWAMLAYARDEDPAPHLTQELRRMAFGNEKGIIDRTSKTFTERKEKRKAAAQAANAAKYGKSPNRTKSEPIGANRTESEPIGANRSQSQHNNNNNNNYNYNNNNNKGGGRTYGGSGKRSGDAHTVGQETIL